MADPVCDKCYDTGKVITGGDELPCECPAGETAMFFLPNVEGLITGKEYKRHFVIGAPDPVKPGPDSIVFASSLPGRKKAQSLSS